MSRLLPLALVASMLLGAAPLYDKYAPGVSYGTSRGVTDKLATAADGGLTAQKTGAGVALFACDTAGANTPGCVSTGAQTFGGQKAFSAPLVLDAGLNVPLARTSGGTGTSLAADAGAMLYSATTGVAASGIYDAGMLWQSGGRGAPTAVYGIYSTTLDYAFAGSLPGACEETTKKPGVPGATIVLWCGVVRGAYSVDAPADLFECVAPDPNGIRLRRCNIGNTDGGPLVDAGYRWTAIYE